MRFTKDGCGRTVVDRGMGYVAPALGNCFTGSCADALAPYGWMSPPCGTPPDQAMAWQAAQMLASQGRSLQGMPQGVPPALGNCFTGSCADALAPYGWMSPPCGLGPIDETAWAVARDIVSAGRSLQGPIAFVPRAPRGFLKGA